MSHSGARSIRRRVELLAQFSGCRLTDFHKVLEGTGRMIRSKWFDGAEAYSNTMLGNWQG